MRQQKRIALITGASSGIGAAVARLLAGQGWHVLLVARRQERLSLLAAEIEQTGGLASIFPADLSLEISRQDVIQAVQGSIGHIDVLINNAGFGWYGYYATMPWPTVQEMLQVNIGAAAHLTRLVIPGMLERNTGHLIHIGSVAGNLPSQGVALYSATKSFLYAFNTSLYRELRGTNVHTSLICAGPVRTDFFQTAANHPAGKHIPVEHWGVSAELIAKRVQRLLHRPRRRIFVPGWLAIVPWVELALGWLPDRLGPLLLEKLHK